MKCMLPPGQYCRARQPVTKYEVHVPTWTILPSPAASNYILRACSHLDNIAEPGSQETCLTEGQLSRPHGQLVGLELLVRPQVPDLQRPVYTR